MMKKNGWLVYSSSLVTEKYMEINQIYIRAAEKLNINLEPVKNTEIYPYFEDNSAKIKLVKSVCAPDFILFLDKDIRLAMHLEKCRYKIFNSSEAIAACDDKIAMAEALSNKNIPIPKTIFSHLYFNNHKDSDEEFILFIEKELAYPLIIKEAFGSFGEQVYLINNRDELLKKRFEILLKPHIYQEFIKSSFGRDVRIHVVGGKIVASMLRTSKNDFRANISSGGEMSEYEPNDEFKQIALQAAKALKLDFCGVDILFSEDDKPIICEVNSNAHIRNIMLCTGINIAEKILKYILEEV